MSKAFWLKKWDDNDIPFHNTAVHPELISYWPKLNLKPNALVLVPLCGKSVDMHWLAKQGHHVVGVELSKKAINDFFIENNIEYDIKDNTYIANQLTLIQADIFEVELTAKFDAIYDRAALVALPQKLREAYVKRLHQSLADGGQLLVKCVSFDQGLIEGPPFSVSEDELALYFELFSDVNCLNKQTMHLSEDDFLYKKGVKQTQGRLYLLKK